MRRSPKTEPLRRQTKPQSGSRQFVSYHSSRKSFEPSAPPSRRSLADSKIKKVVADPAKLPIVLIGLVIAACMLYSTTLTSSAKLIVTNPSGVPKLRSNSDYQQTVDKILASSLINKNKITIDPAKLEQQVLQELSEIRSASVVLPLMGHRPIVELTPARPMLTLASQSGVYIIDSNGRAILSAKDLPAGTLLDVPTVQDEANLEVEKGKAALSRQDVTFITTLVKQLEAKKLKISSLTLPTLASELHIKLKGTKYPIKFSLLTDPNVVAGQYLAFRDKLDQLNVTPAKYIDARVEERVYYK